jgi:hypothetical protein
MATLERHVCCGHMSIENSQKITYQPFSKHTQVSTWWVQVSLLYLYLYRYLKAVNCKHFLFYLIPYQQNCYFPLCANSLLQTVCNQSLLWCTDHIQYKRKYLGFKQKQTLIAQNRKINLFMHLSALPLDCSSKEQIHIMDTKYMRGIKFFFK